VVSVVEEKIKEFNERKIEKWYPFVYLDGSILKIRRDVVEGEVVYIVRCPQFLDTFNVRG
jgi:putative transposase